MKTDNLDAPFSPAHSRAPLIVAASVSTLGGFLFGYDNIVISGAIGYLSQLFRLDAAGIGWAAGCALIGCIAGCAAAGTVADYLGKKKGLALCALCFALSSVGMLFASDLHQFVLWRLIGGVGIGAASVISPNYIAEIAPTRVRGAPPTPLRSTHRRSSVPVSSGSPPAEFARTLRSPPPDIQS